MDLISIIIPVYNVEKYLHQCIQSIINQTYYNLEIILIDDGSTDESSTICDFYANTDNRISVIHKQNTGVSSSRNIGIENAKGKYISFIDADDYLEKNFYEVMVKNASEYNADCSYIGYKKYDEKNDIEETVSKKVIIEVKSGLEALDDMGGEDDPWLGYACNKLFLKSIINKYQLRFDENLIIFEDNAFCYAYIVHCKCCVCDPSPLYVYRMRNTSITNSIFSNYDKLRHLLDGAETLYNFAKQFKNRKVFFRASNLYKNQCLRYLFYMFKNKKYTYNENEIFEMTEKIFSLKKECPELKFSNKEKIFFSLLKISPKATYFLSRFIH